MGSRNRALREPTERYVAPFIRRLMKDASEEEIQEASENLRQYLLLMWRIYCRREEEGTMGELSDKKASPTSTTEKKQPMGFRLR